MNKSLQIGVKQDKRRFPVRSEESLRSPILRVSFIHSDIADIKRSLRELEHAQMRVRADVVLTPEQFTKRLALKRYNLILAEYPATKEWETRAVEALRQ